MGVREDEGGGGGRKLASRRPTGSMLRRSNQCSAGVVFISEPVGGRQGGESEVDWCRAWLDSVKSYTVAVNSCHTLQAAFSAAVTAEWGRELGEGLWDSAGRVER